MKRPWLLILTLSLLLLPAIVLSETWYVQTPTGKSLSLRNPQNNTIIANIPNGTALEPDSRYSSDTAAYVSWSGRSGYVAWSSLTREAPANAPAPAAAPPVDDLLPTDGAGSITVQAFNAAITYAGRRSGKYSAVSYDTPVQLQVAASLPKGQTLEYWVIDGVRYDFKPKVPAAITLDQVTDNMVIEAVAKGRDSQTLLTPTATGASGARRVVETVNAKLGHVNKKLSVSGGWIKSFDFTDNYVNRATKKREAGGQVTLCVKAVIPKGKKLSYWKFDGAHLSFDKNVTEMVVHALGVSKTYEAVMVKPAVKEAKASEEGPAMYTVRCSGCVFSGGDYTNATSGTVPANTKITIKNTTGKTVSFWRANDSVLTHTITDPMIGKVSVPTTSDTVVRTITRDTVIVCFGE